MNNHKPIHALVYGEPHVGKSTFARTFPAPYLVFFFDPYGKDAPYLQLPGTTIVDEQADDQGTPRKQVWTEDKKTLISQIEYYQDQDLSGQCYKNFLDRLVTLSQEHWWKTLIVDSLTFMQIKSRMYEKYVLNPGARDPRRLYGGVTDTIEETMMIRFGSFPCNVVLVAHTRVIEDEKTKEIKYTINSHGRLVDTMGSGFSDYLRMYVDRDGNRQVQTLPDWKWTAQSSMGAPNPCAPHYEALFENLKGE
jgi:hypothetical protein